MQTEHSTAARKEKKAQPWYLQLWFQVLVAMAIGIALGHLYPDSALACSRSVMLSSKPSAF
jgi:Na+/H+-dicarboxylate symporter